MKSTVHSLSLKVTPFSGSVFIDLVAKLTTFHGAKIVVLNRCDCTLKFKSNELMNAIMHPIYIIENYRSNFCRRQCFEKGNTGVYPPTVAALSVLRLDVSGQSQDSTSQEVLR